VAYIYLTSSPSLLLHCSSIGKFWINWFSFEIKFFENFWDFYILIIKNKPDLGVNIWLLERDCKAS